MTAPFGRVGPLRLSNIKVSRVEKRSNAPSNVIPTALCAKWRPVAEEHALAACLSSAWGSRWAERVFDNTLVFFKFSYQVTSLNPKSNGAIKRWKKKKHHQKQFLVWSVACQTILINVVHCCPKWKQKSFWMKRVRSWSCNDEMISPIIKWRKMTQIIVGRSPKR